MLDFEQTAVCKLVLHRYQIVDSLFCGRPIPALAKVAGRLSQRHRGLFFLKLDLLGPDHNVHMIFLLLFEKRLALEL
jgi:hypothetical protein